MSYFKCRDCDYFEKGTFIYSSCPYNSAIFGSSSPCGSFVTHAKSCGDCAKYKDNGKCGAESFFSTTKRYSNHPACQFFKPNDECFLTSACVGYQGKPDDCEELTVLRSFRDGYMRTLENGEALIKEYYKIAPKIVEEINASQEKEKYYAYISEVINKCVKFISAQDNESALREYISMVNKLKAELIS